MIARWCWALASGLLFGFGLVLSQMINPRRVQGFLDPVAWDPTLALVIVSATGTAMIGYRLVLKRSRPLADTHFHLPAASRIDRRLITGAALFGLGWGLAGYCPGPALTAAALGFREPLVVLVGIVAGSMLVDFWRGRSVPPDRPGRAGDKRSAAAR